MKIEKVKINEINYIRQYLYRDEYEELYEMNKEGIFLIPLMKKDKGYVNLGFDTFITYIEDRGEEIITGLIVDPMDYIKYESRNSMEVIDLLKEIFRIYLEGYRKIAKRIISNERNAV
ncbi:MAG: hypothetical protein QXW48_01480 [Thermoplasmata archaeon]